MYNSALVQDINKINKQTEQLVSHTWTDCSQQQQQV